MPDHVHGIIVIDPYGVNAGAGSEPAPTFTVSTIFARNYHGLPEIIRQFKTYSARRINEIRKTQGAPVWQRNYYEHLIRNESALKGIRRYIRENPKKWYYDK